MCTTTKCRITISMLKATMQLNISTLCRGTIQWHLCAACECQTKSLSALCSALWTYVETCHRNCFVLSKKSKPVLAVAGNTEGQREKSTCYVTFSQIRNFFWAQHLCISFLFLGLYLIFQQPIFDYFELGKQSLVESHLGSEYSSKRFVRKILLKK